MLDLNRINGIAADVAHRRFSYAALERVMSEPATDSEGRDALRITIVLKPEAVAKLTGDQTLDTLFRIQQNLQKAGEERFAFVEYATQEELDDIGDPRS